MTNHPNRSKHQEQQAKYVRGSWHATPCYFGGILDHIEINGETDCVAITKSEANGRLIAAAPELLAALKDTLEYIEGYAESADADDPCHEMLKRWQALVAKAEGRSVPS